MNTAGFLEHFFRRLSPNSCFYSSRLPIFSMREKGLLEVYYRTLEFRLVYNDKKQLFQCKITAAMAGHLYGWGECVLGETSIGRFLWQQEYGCGL